MTVEVRIKALDAAHSSAKLYRKVTFGSVNMCKLLTVVFVLTLVAYSSCDEVSCPNIITRSMWGAMTQTETEYLIFPAKYAIIIHTATPECTDEVSCANRVANIQNFHMTDRGYHDIGYNFLVGGDGNVYEGGGWHKLGAHTLKYNTQGVGIALIGEFDTKSPPPAQLEAAKKLVACGFAAGNLAKNYKLMGHRQLVATISPGLKVYQAIQKWPHWSRDPFPKTN